MVSGKWYDSRRYSRPGYVAMNMQDKDSTELMVQAGNLLGRQWNLQGSARSPFAENAHLDSTAQIGALLN